MTLPGTNAGHSALTRVAHLSVAMVFKRTLCVRVNRVCVGKSREEIVSEVVKAFSQPLIAVQIGFDTIRVTFRDVESFRTAHAKTHVPIFGINCVVQGGGSSSHHGPHF